MKIRFNFEMMTGFNISLLNSTLIDMYLVPANNRHLEDPAFNISNLNFTWDTVSFSQDEL